MSPSRWPLTLPRFVLVAAALVLGMGLWGLRTHGARRDAVRSAARFLRVPVEQLKVLTGPKLVSGPGGGLCSQLIQF